MSETPKSPLYVHGPETIDVDGMKGSRYWVYKETIFFTGQTKVNEKLSGLPIVIFPAIGTNPEYAPTIILFQQLGTPYHTNGFLIPTLTELGINVFMFDYAFTGCRQLSDLVKQDPNICLTQFERTIMALDKSTQFNKNFIRIFLNRLYQDLYYILLIGSKYHNCKSKTIFLYGYGFGGILASILFNQCKFGVGLYLINSHTNISKFTKTNCDIYLPGLSEIPISNIETYVQHNTPTLCRQSLLILCRNLMDEASEISRIISCFGHPLLIHLTNNNNRRIRMLVSDDDQTIKSSDALRDSQSYPHSECIIIPELVYDISDNRWSPEAIQHIRYFMSSQLSFLSSRNPYHSEFTDPFFESIPLFGQSIQFMSNSKQIRRHDDSLQNIDSYSDRHHYFYSTNDTNRNSDRSSNQSSSNNISINQDTSSEPNKKDNLKESKSFPQLSFQLNTEFHPITPPITSTENKTKLNKFTNNYNNNNCNIVNKVIILCKKCGKPFNCNNCSSSHIH